MTNAVDKEAALALSPLRVISAVVDKEAALALSQLKMVKLALVAVKVKIQPPHLVAATILL